MSDSIIDSTAAITNKLVADSKEQLKKLQTIKAMTKMAGELGEDTAPADRLIDAAEGMLKDLIGKLAIKK